MPDPGANDKLLSILLVCYGQFPHYSCRALNSLYQTLRLAEIADLHVGCNACCPQTLDAARQGTGRGLVTTLIESRANLHKDPMLRLLLGAARTPYVLMMDDDSYLKSGWEQALLRFLREQDPLDVAGHLYWWPRSPVYQRVVEQRPWWRGMQQVPREQRERILFCTGGLLLARTQFLRQHDFPDAAMRIEFDDAMLGELVHHVGGRMVGFDNEVLASVVINDGKRRWQLPAQPAPAPAAPHPPARRVTVDQAMGFAVDHLRRREYPQAEAACRKILAGAPQHPDALHLLGLVAHQTGRPHMALDLIGQSILLRPENPEAHNNLGNVLIKFRRLDEAAGAFAQAVQLNPDFAEARNNLANTLARQGRTEQAVAEYQHAIRLRPGYGEAHANLGNALLKLERWEEAEQWLLKALQLNGRNLRALWDLASVRQGAGRLDGAVEALDRALEQRPDHARTHLNRALLLLMAGRFAEGWEEYEWRWRVDARGKPDRFAQPLWDGGDLNGRTLLLHCEQGLGSTMQFIRYVPAIDGGRVIVECQPPLKRLLRLALPPRIELLAQKEPLPAFDVQLPLLSLPRVRRTTLDTIPVPIAYLRAEAGLASRWAEELAGHEGMRVGIAWQGNPNYGGDRQRSIALKHFEPLARVPGVRLFGLQKNKGSEQLPPLAKALGIVDLGPRLDVQAGAFMDTAAVIASLDLVITSDTSIAHLAGAMGRPVWVALCHVPDWRWMLEREDSPWYPGVMRLFRQERPGDWERVFGRLAEALRREVARRQS